MAKIGRSRAIAALTSAISYSSRDAETPSVFSCGVLAVERRIDVVAAEQHQPGMAGDDGVGRVVLDDQLVAGDAGEAQRLAVVVHLARGRDGDGGGGRRHHIRRPHMRAGTSMPISASAAVSWRR